MKIESILLEDGQIQIQITGSRDDIEQLANEEMEFDLDAVSKESPNVGNVLMGWKLKNPFKNRPYCVTCENGDKHTIHAPNGALAAVRAAMICVPHSLSKGGC